MNTPSTHEFAAETSPGYIGPAPRRLLSEREKRAAAGTVAAKRVLEVHRHVFISGPRAGQTIVHSHEGGHSDPSGAGAHTHPDTGPARFTIDADEWARATGLKGGGKKKFTKRATGEQLPIRASGPAAYEIPAKRVMVRVRCNECGRRHGGKAVRK